MGMFFQPAYVSLPGNSATVTLGDMFHPVGWPWCDGGLALWDFYLCSDSIGIYQSGRFEQEVDTWNFRNFVPLKFSIFRHEHGKKKMELGKGGAHGISL